MPGKVVPLGYGVPGAMQVIDELMGDPTVLLIDTRFVPRSVLPQWRRQALAEKYGARYRWAGRYLGNKNYKTGGPIELADEEGGLRGLGWHLEKGHTLILLCYCPDYDLCHRKVIVEKLLARMPHVAVEQPFVRCMSLWQPWAFLLSNPQLLVACGVEPKTIENREWSTGYRGPLLIHASTTFDPSCFSGRKLDGAFWRERYGAELLEVLPQGKDAYATRAIVGAAYLEEVVTWHKSRWFTGTYGLVMRGARPIEPPIAYPGRQKLFFVPWTLLRGALPHTELPDGGN
jgi:hypothetical protein